VIGVLYSIPLEYRRGMARCSSGISARRVVEAISAEVRLSTIIQRIKGGR